jgi:hypothetical protein
MKGDVIRGKRLARAAAVFLLLGAVLPNVTYLGHIGVDSHSHAAEAARHDPSGENGEEHTLHCHTGPARCAGAQAMVGAIWVGEDAGLLAPAAETSTAIDSLTLTSPEAPVLRILEPPRTA